MEFMEEQQLLENDLLSNYAKLSEDATRIYEEAPSKYKTFYQEDFEKILYSDAFRRLRSKTQVFYASGKNQHNRTRLTHTLEVAHTAKLISKSLKLNTDLVEAISLGHDLGHAPFGHAGERALNDCLKKYGKSFNHNAQSVWVASTTSIGKKNISGSSIFSFNLTRDTLEGIWKHTKIAKSINEHIFLSELNPDDEKGSLEAQVVNLSDTIAYNFHDIADGIKNNIISQDEFVKEYWDVYFHGIEYNKSDLLDIFINDLIQNNKNNLEYNVIRFSSEIQEAFKALKDFSYEHIVKNKKIISSDEFAKEKISTIFEHYIERIELLTEEKNNKNYKANILKYNKYGPERVVTDYIQWFGDETADREYKKLNQE